jgi:tight adherence protein C
MPEDAPIPPPFSMFHALGPYEYFLAVLWALVAAVAAWYIAQIARQITYVTLADGRRQERTLPMLFRLVLPLAPNLAPFMRRPAFRKTCEKADRDIVAAGFDGLIAGEELVALKFLMPCTYGILWWFFVSGALGALPPDSFVQRLNLPLRIIGVLYLYIQPTMWLAKALKARHKSIERSLPFILDLLTLSVEAGMDFMMALQRCVERRRLDALAEELIRVIRNIQLGMTRKEALREMSRRINLPSLRSVIQALVQADELGVSIGYILRIQSEQIRQRRFERAERLANEAPVKMLFPLLCFIFPAVFLILLGPVIGRLLRTGIL